MQRGPLLVEVSSDDALHSEMYNIAMATRFHEHCITVIKDAGDLFDLDDIS